MTYILSAQRNQDDPVEADRLWDEYAQYVRDNQAVFPSGAFELATSDWYYSFTDHRVVRGSNGPSSRNLHQVPVIKNGS